MKTIKAILWDCDGCLIDSEIVAGTLTVGLFKQAGYDIPVQDYIMRFGGMKRQETYRLIHEESGIDMGEALKNVDRAALRNAAFEAELQAIHGIHDALDRIMLPQAIASGSSSERLEFTLKLTNLYDRFHPHIYSAELVEHGKPFPDIFLYAANRLGVAPQECLVIEDSINGVRAGIAAGMTVFGFTGASHIMDKAAHEKTMRDLGVEIVFNDMQDLPNLLG